MSITRITEGNHNTEIEGSWTVYTDTFEAIAGQFSHFTATEGTFLGNPTKAPNGPANAYVPIINAINDEDTMFKSYEIFINNKEEWVFNEMLDENLRRQKSHEIKFISNTQIHKIKFKVEKGNSNANDDDGGNITALYFRNGDTYSFETQIIKDVKYGDTFLLDWECKKDISQVQFYANDNDLFFDGGITNVYCGAVKRKRSKILQIWEAYPKKEEISRDELFIKIGGYLKKWYDEIKSNPSNEDFYSLDNTCALRMSYALNYSGFKIPEKQDANYKTFKGESDLNYFITVDNIRRYLLETISIPPQKVTRTDELEVIFIESECGWNDATGHVDVMVSGKYGIDYHIKCKSVIGWIDID